MFKKINLKDIHLKKPYIKASKNYFYFNVSSWSELIKFVDPKSKFEVSVDEEKNSCMFMFSPSKKGLRFYIPNNQTTPHGMLMAGRLIAHFRLRGKLFLLQVLPKEKSFILMAQ